MDKSPVSFWSISFTIVFSLVILFLAGFSDIFYHKTRVIFCDVGQGDAAYIRTKEKQDILIDAGPDRKVLNCLGKYMPFYDHKIELAFLSHPQKDHFGGYLFILDRYQIGYFVMTSAENSSQSFNQLKEKLAKTKIKIKNVYAGDAVALTPAPYTAIKVLWPGKELVVANPGDLNEISGVFIFSQGDFDILFTGDASPNVLNSLVGTIHELSLQKINILKIPHHGSKNGLTKKFLKLADPELSLISVGKNNAYGHPAAEILEMLKALKKKYLRTDEKGDIVVEVEERGWRVK